MLSAPLSYELVHSFVRVRRAPLTSAPELGMLRKGTIVSVCAIDGAWVQLQEMEGAEPERGAQTTPALGDPAQYGGGWMLTDGKELGLGKLLAPHVVELAPGTRWQVTWPGGCVGYERPGGQVVDSSDHGKRLDGCEEGASVEVTAECGLWTRVRTAGGTAWVEMDAFMAG